MPLRRFVCTKCGKVIEAFDDELEDGCPVQTDCECFHSWVRDDILKTATYTKMYTSEHPQWDKFHEMDDQLKDWDNEIKRDNDDKAFRKAMKK